MFAIVVVGVAMGLYFANIGDKSENKLEPITAAVFLDFGNETIWGYQNITVNGENVTVLGFLFAVAREGSFEVAYTYYGQHDSYLIDSIDEAVNGDDNKYWQYWINGEYGIIGADKQPVHNGDVMEWKFTGF